MPFDVTGRFAVSIEDWAMDTEEMKGDKNHVT